jgi:hypothetical protein
MAIGKELSPILEEIENSLLEFSDYKPEFTKEGFRAAIFIFSSVMVDKMFERQELIKTDLKQREDQAEQLGTEIKILIEKYTGLDTFKIFE